MKSPKTFKKKNRQSLKQLTANGKSINQIRRNSINFESHDSSSPNVLDLPRFACFLGMTGKLQDAKITSIVAAA